MVSCVSESEGFIVSGSEDTTVQVFNSQTLKRVSALKEHTAFIKAVAAFDGGCVTASDDGTVKVWDASFVCIGTFLIKAGDNNSSTDISAIALTQDARLVVIAIGTSIQVWDLKKLECVGSIPTGHESDIASLLVYGKYVLTGSGDHTIKVWDMTVEKEACPPLEGHGKYDVLLCL